MKLKITLPLLTALCILTACNDDFFDQVPDDRITIEQVFQQTSYSEKYLATVYSYIRDESHRTNGVPWDPCSDDLDVTYDREDYNSFKMNLGNWSASSNYYEYWTHYYRGIRSATYFIQHIGSNQEMLDDPTRGPIVVEQYKNEARFLRAWFYYCLLRQYGPCVLLGDDVLSGDLDRDDVKMNLPRSPYDECVDYIVRELDDMIDNNRLPLHFTTQADKDYGRATLAMCMGLKSRVLLLAASDQFNGNPAYANVVNTCLLYTSKKSASPTSTRISAHRSGRAIRTRPASWSPSWTGTPAARSDRARKPPPGPGTRKRRRRSTRDRSSPTARSSSTKVRPAAR